MDMYRVVVCKAKKRWCVVDIEHLDARTILADVTARFPLEQGFDISVVKKHGEKRLLEVSPAGVKMLSAEPLFELFPFN